MPAAVKPFSTFNLHDLRSAFAGKVFALVPVTHADGYWVAGVAVANERGYSPLPISWASVPIGPDAYETFAAYLDGVNLYELGVPEPEAGRIVASSMRRSHD